MPAGLNEGTLHRTHLRYELRMPTNGARLKKKIRFSVVFAGATLASAGLVAPARTQEAGAPADVSTESRTRIVTHDAQPPRRERRQPDEHRFWDKTNDWLFTGVAASRTLDYFSTLNMRRRGRQEILLSNDAVDNHAAFAMIEAAGTGASIGASYLLHRTGHHKLERWVSIVHIGMATTGSVRNYCLQTFHTIPAQSAP
jgi:hypothetical protein